MCHPKTSMAAPTPVTDGQHVYALFATGDLAAFDRDGDLLWYRALDARLSRHQQSSRHGRLAGAGRRDAAVTAGKRRRFVRAGRGREDRPQSLEGAAPPRHQLGDAGVTRFHDKTAALFQTSGEITAYDVSNGEILWSYKGGSLGSVPSPVVVDDLVIVPGNPSVALRVSEGGKPEVVWKSRKLAAAYASPGRVQGADLRHDRHWRQLSGRRRRARKSGASGSAPASPRRPSSPTASCTSPRKEGDTSVVQLGDKPKILANNALKEPLLATPAIANGAIYLRTEKHLYCIAAKK